MTEPEYHHQTGEVPVGEKYESVTTEEGTIHLEDIVVWSDPDCMHHDSDVTEAIFVGFIDAIYKRDKPEFGTTCPLGRIEDDRNLKAISGKEIYLDKDGSSIVLLIDSFIQNIPDT